MIKHHSIIPGIQNSCHWSPPALHHRRSYSHPNPHGSLCCSPPEMRPAPDWRSFGHNRPQPSNSLKPRLGSYIVHGPFQVEVGAGAVHPQGLGHGLHYALCHDFPTQVEWISDVLEIGKAPCKPAPWEPHPPGRGLNLWAHLHHVPHLWGSAPLQRCLQLELQTKCIWETALWTTASACLQDGTCHQSHKCSAQSTKITKYHQVPRCSGNCALYIESHRLDTTHPRTHCLCCSAHYRAQYHSGCPAAPRLWYPSSQLAFHVAWVGGCKSKAIRGSTDFDPW